MAAYIRLDGVDPDDLDDAEGNLFGELANGAFTQLRADAPDLFEELDGAIPVRRPEYDPRLLQTTSVYVHRDETVDDGDVDFVFCSFGADVDGLAVPHSGTPHQFTEVQLTQQFDDDKGRLDRDAWGSFVASLPTEAEREQAGDDPVRVGTLAHDGTRVVRVDFDSDTFEEDGEQDA